MRPTGEPTQVGEVRYQQGAIATSIASLHHRGGLQWRVRRTADGDARYTPQLAHAGHWSESRIPQQNPPPAVGGLAAYAGQAAGTAVAGLMESFKATAPAGTLFYPDLSNNNWNSVQDAINFLEQLAAEGFAGVCHKVSEGNYYEDPFWQPVKEWCAANGLPCLGYHYVTTNDPASQAETWNANDGGDYAMFDFEANSGNMSNFWAVADGFNAAGVMVGPGYIPNWYWNEVGGGDLSGVPVLVSSAYPTSGAGYASSLYAQGGGDGGGGWNSYGNAAPAVWQFTDAAIIAGKSVDCNAFRGTPEQLAQLFTGEGTPTVDPTTDPTLAVAEDNQEQLRGPDLNGWPQLAGHTVVDALAVIGQTLGIPGFTPPK